MLLRIPPCPAGRRTLPLVGACFLTLNPMSTSLSRAAKRWLTRFDRLPHALCYWCLFRYDGDRSLDELERAVRSRRGEACKSCGYRFGWVPSPAALPPGRDAFLGPRDEADQAWFRAHVEAVEALGFEVYESNECGILVAVPDTDHDFLSRCWTPLFRMRRQHVHRSLRRPTRG